MFECLLVNSHLNEFFSYPAAVTITGDRAAKLDLCLALVAFSSEGSFTCHTCCDMGPMFLRSFERPVILTSKRPALLKEQSLPVSMSKN
jgi:hypothetical protein